MSFDAMLLAAGLGTRLRPLTHTVPKALVPVAGVPMLERVARRVIEAGADRIVINVQYLADQIIEYVESVDGWGVDVRVSVEPESGPLETGGGLLHAADHFRRDRPILIHNTDVLADFGIAPMLDAHRDTGALATLAVMQREKSRALIFDRGGLCGAVGRDDEIKLAREADGPTEYLGFCGVHVIEPRLIDELTETGVFSIIHPYLRLAGAGERILPHRVDGTLWIDIGTHERLEEAATHVGDD